MRKPVLLLLATCSLYSAQTTITKAFNDPIIGETVNNNTVNGTVDNSATGADTTFNNASLTQGAAAPTIYSAPTASEISTFPGTTIKMTGSGNTILYKQSSSKLEITGLITPDATLNFSTNNGTFISYPAAYGYTETDNAQGTFTSSAANGNFSGTINISADASGVLMIGAKTYTNILRIKSVQVFNLTVSGFPVGTITNTAYSYYDNTHKFPLLSFTSANINIPALSMNQTTTGAQALNEAFLAAEDHFSKKENLKIYPNPAQDFIEIKGNSKDYSTVKVYSLDGKLVKTSDIRAGKVQVSELPPAAYFIEVSGKNLKTETTKLIKK
ncbi:hypothetical protein HNP38_002801 [Chryseobacterium defluvii]|uniref:Secretion system C-terminal sorting domain-containing protein n=1 Tax=Chryseobacterium defluvii TaxID=160396 RepID=A0A840KFT9_9FLAO|nr:T9SS type A sorting domain-containing protein [Chryseobacterium defluvii]MBB4807495.1 hypothetical protein [Chryseobacterium defluvii]